MNDNCMSIYTAQRKKNKKKKQFKNSEKIQMEITCNEYYCTLGI